LSVQFRFIACPFEFGDKFLTGIDNVCIDFVIHIHVIFIVAVFVAQFQQCAKYPRIVVTRTHCLAQYGKRGVFTVGGYPPLHHFAMGVFRLFANFGGVASELLYYPLPLADYNA
jgi:hypothetical protein